MRGAVVSGATGAVGRALVEALIREHIEVLVLCRPGSKRNDFIPEHPLIKKVPCSLDMLRTLSAQENSYEVFYHLAWAGTTGADRNNWYLQNENVRYTLDAVAAAKRLGCSCFVGVGSQAEYGRVNGVLTPETPTFPENGYGMAKLCAGQMTRAYAHELGLRHVWGRILSVYGPGDGKQSMVMSAIRQFMSGEPGRFTKGEQQWDYLYSGDAAEALLLMGRFGMDGKTYVLGSGQVHSLRWYIEEIRSLTNPEAEAVYGAIPYANRQVMHLEADISALRGDLGWEPKVSFLDGIRQTIQSDYGATG